MKSFVESIRKRATELQDELFALACRIFDRPEIGGEEKFASALITEYLEKKDFKVERGIAGLPTAFRATWERGEGGPVIGFCMEYDALEEIGHACGHHLQSPACIGAALILRELCQKPLRIVLYGTPDEERFGGKIPMAEKGVFSEADVVFSCHSGGKTFVSGGNRALAATRVTFHGKTAHASGAPQNGRSALDAMMLAFHGLEIMREHVEDGCRIHYTVLTGTGPSNVVHEKAYCHVTLRSYDKNYLADMKRRMKKVIDGACMMTETTADFEYLPEYWNILPIPSLNAELLRAAELFEVERLRHETMGSGGSSDVGNVSWVCPTALFYTFYSDAKAHTADYLTEGKSEAAKSSMLSAAKVFALTAMELVHHPEKLAAIQKEHQAMLEK